MSGRGYKNGNLGAEQMKVYYMYMKTDDFNFSILQVFCSLCDSIPCCVEAPSFEVISFADFCFCYL